MQNSVSSLQIASNGNSFWAGCDDGSIEIWDVGSSRQIQLFNDHESRVYSIDLSLDSKLAISADQNGKIILRHMRTFEKLFETFIEGESILSIAFSPDASKVAAGMRDGAIYLWDIKSDGVRTYILNEKIHKPVFESWVDGITFSVDGTKIEARGGSWNNRRIKIIGVNDLSSITDVEEKIAVGPVGSFGKYRLGFGKTELSVRSGDNLSEIAWYPKALEFAILHPKKRQWAGVQRYNLHHFRLEGGV